MCDLICQHCFMMTCWQLCGGLLVFIAMRLHKYLKFECNMDIGAQVCVHVCIHAHMHTLHGHTSPLALPKPLRTRLAASAQKVIGLQDGLCNDVKGKHPSTYSDAAIFASVTILASQGQDSDSAGCLKQISVSDSFDTSCPSLSLSVFVSLCQCSSVSVYSDSLSIPRFVSFYPSVSFVLVCHNLPVSICLINIYIYICVSLSLYPSVAVDLCLPWSHM